MSVSAPVIKTTGALIGITSLIWNPCRSGMTERLPKAAGGIAQITWLELPSMPHKHGSRNGIMTFSLFRRGCRGRKSDGEVGYGGSSHGEFRTFTGNDKLGFAQL